MFLSGGCEFAKRGGRRQPGPFAEAWPAPEREAEDAQGAGLNEGRCPMSTTRRGAIAFALAVPFLAAAGCTRMYRNHGHVPSDDELAAVVVGQTTRDELEYLVGRPGSQGVLTGSSWYYVGSRWERYGLNPPREIDRQVVAISFNEAGTVSNVERFGLERGRIVTLSRRVTDSGVQGSGLLRQLMGNVGRFNAGDVLGGAD
jgi:outer membrane protein assembly factor BamE (lipoprotein component of BamABCDE complex)